MTVILFNYIGIRKSNGLSFKVAGVILFGINLKCFVSSNYSLFYTIIMSSYLPYITAPPRVIHDINVQHTEWVFSLYYLAGTIQRLNNATGMYKDESLAIAEEVANLKFPFEELDTICHYSYWQYESLRPTLTQEIWDSRKFYLFFRSILYLHFFSLIRSLPMPLFTSLFLCKAVCNKVAAIIWKLRRNAIR